MMIRGISLAALACALLALLAAAATAQPPADEPLLQMDIPSHTATVRALAFTHDSKRLCSAGLDKMVHVWNLALVRDLQLTQAPESSLFRERTIRWQIARGPRGSVYSLAASPTERLLALAGHGTMGSGGEIVLVDPALGTHRHTLIQHHDPVVSMTFTPEGKRLLSSSADGHAVAWTQKETGWTPLTLQSPDIQAYSEDVVRTIQQVEHNIDMKAIRPIAAAGDSAIFPVVANAATATPADLRWRLAKVDVKDQSRAQLAAAEHKGIVTALAATSDGTKLASADAHGAVYLWDLTSGNVVRLESPAPIMSLAFSPDGATLATGSQPMRGRPSVLTLYDVANPAAPQVRERREVGRNHISTIAYSPNGRILAYTGGLGNTVFHTSITDREDTSAVTFRGRQIFKVAFAKQGYRVGIGDKPRDSATANDLADVSMSFEPTQLKLDPESPDETNWRAADDGAGDWQVRAERRSLRLTHPDGKALTVAAPHPRDGRPRSWCWITDGAGNARAIAVGTERQNNIYVFGLKELEEREISHRELRTAVINLRRFLDTIPNGNGWKTFLHLEEISQQLSSPFDIDSEVLHRAIERFSSGEPGLDLPQFAAVRKALVRHQNALAAYILRAFRGHEDWVASLSVSSDRRYLVSGSADGTARLWSMSGWEEGAKRRFGATLQTRGNRLTVESIDKAGPLFHRGVRQGDVLTEIRFEDETSETRRQVAVEPAKILAALSRVSAAAQVRFSFTSAAGDDRPPFYLAPAWQPLASLYISADNEWAYWTPAGYYGASLNGHRMFGWQVRRGVERLPDFYRADQFRQKLERPEAIERLLITGNLYDALGERRSVLAPPDPHEELSRQIAKTPMVRILSPQPGDPVGDSVKVSAEIEIPAGLRLILPRAFANGVAAARVGGEALEHHENGSVKLLRYTWKAALPAERVQWIQVHLSTREGVFSFDGVKVVRQRPAAPPKRRMFILAAGVNHYVDEDIRSLQYAVGDARAIAQALSIENDSHYVDKTTTLLVDEQVTAQGWRSMWDQQVQLLREKNLRPDDVIVIFLAGHGVVSENPGGGAQYYFAGYDADRSALLAGQPYGFISFERFDMLADLPCRKVVLLDTCYSGAVQPAVRTFQEDVIFTLTATSRNEEAQEEGIGDNWGGHGAFTRCLLDGLEGAANQNQDDAVTLDELSRYVKRTVPVLTAEFQHPASSPDLLFPYAEIILSP